MKKEVIEVEGMHCPSCVALLEGDIGDLNGVSYAKADLGAATLTVEYDETKISLGDIKSGVADSGFKAL